MYRSKFSLFSQIKKKNGIREHLERLLDNKGKYFRLVLSEDKIISFIFRKGIDF